MSITSTPYGTLPSGEAVDLFTLTNANGLSAEVTNYGAILVSLNVLDREGALTDVVLGKDSLEDYLAGHPCFGSICGRVAGRIGGASFELDGKTYQLEANYEGISNLHSGPEGFHTMLWKAEIIEDFGVQKLQLQLTDPDGHNGFPGEVHCTVTYALLDNDALEIHYEASSDHTTPFNPTNHSYFNLRGQGDILGHELQIFADSVATVDENCTLIGRRDPVVAGYNDYREPVQLGSLETLEVGNADIHFFLNEGRSAQAKLAARVVEPDSGRIMEVLTTEPGVQFYAGLCLSEEGPEIGKGGVHHEPMHALCLETQDYADSIHFPEMGNAILKPGETFKSTTLFRFSTK
ncbi:MAG TPA: galactose-1-epimerase [Opitutae bacterium]|nr:galactose-1-epimerase [Puniceicoccaceae bacterium]HBR92823.1 galactose-1-epimerase [Opitutae bacterium]|tara:strand:+ start:2807 stop:3853 length:1047 start_codon:yes stop_codon:yes gene_type:complete